MHGYGGYGYEYSRISTELSKRQRLCNESNNARRALDAARLVVGQAEVRFTRSEQAITEFNKEQVKCECNTCPTCGKEK